MKTHLFLRNAYNYDMEAASKSSGLSCSDESKTDQSFVEECDINTIVREFGVTGQLPDQEYRPPLEGDFTEVVDYQTALNLVIQADAAFLSLPSATRERFNNDPAKYVAFASDPANEEEMRKFGMLKPPKAPVLPIAVQVVPSPQAPTPETPPNASKKGATSAPAAE